MKKTTLIITLALYVCLSNAQTINTIAGGGIGFSGDGGAATSAGLNSPSAVFIDIHGNIYIAETNFSGTGANIKSIRKVNASTGIVSTIAGGGTGGDGGPAISASLNNPGGIFVNSSGDVYISDNNSIRLVTASTGIISTIAGNGINGYSGDGGAATIAKLSSPMGVCVDAFGNIYIADGGNNRIRKVTASTGKISTIAGNGGSSSSIASSGVLATSTEVHNPNGVALDALGNLHIADFGFGLIRKITTSTGIISTIGSVPALNGLSLDYSGNVYVSTDYDNTIRKINSSTSIVSTIAGNGTAGFSGDGGAGTSAQLNRPFGVSVDSLGNAYIADRDNYRIRKVDASTGIISTKVGNGTCGFAGDGSIATNARLDAPTAVFLDSTGNIYFADNNDNRIKKITASTGIINTIAGIGRSGYLAKLAGFTGNGGLAINAQLWNPSGICVDINGDVYIADEMNDVIRKISSSTGVISTFAGNGVYGFSGDGALAINAKLKHPSGVCLDVLGNLYILDSYNSRVRKVSASSGIITTFAGSSISGYYGDYGIATNAQLNHPRGLCIDGAGNIYIADRDNHTIRKITASTGIINTIAGDGTLGYSGDGNLAINSQLHNPEGVSVDNIGNVYIADTYNNSVRKIDVSTGIISTIAATLSAKGVFVDFSGNVYVAGDSRIRKIGACPASIISTNSATTFCEGSSVVLNANTGGSLTYQWQQNGTDISGEINSSYSANASGSYSVIVTNSSSCSTTAPATSVTVNPLPTAAITVGGATTFCQGSNVVLNANTGTGLTYQWQNNNTNISGATSDSYTSNAAGNYMVVVVTNPESCSTTSSATAVTVNSLPIVTLATITSPLCDNNSPTLLSGYPTGGVFSGIGVSGFNFDPAITGAGTFTVTYQYIDSNSCSATTNQPVTVDLCTGIAELSNSLLVIYPTPAQSKITSEFEVIEKENAIIEIRNVLGQTLTTISEDFKNGKNKIEIDISKFPNGLYFIQLHNQNKLFKAKFIKQ